MPALTAPMPPAIGDLRRVEVGDQVDRRLGNRAAGAIDEDHGHALRRGDRAGTERVGVVAARRDEDLRHGVAAPHLLDDRGAGGVAVGAGEADGVGLQCLQSILDGAGDGAGSADEVDGVGVETVDLVAHDGRERAGFCQKQSTTEGSRGGSGRERVRERPSAGDEDRGCFARERSLRDRHRRRESVRARQSLLVEAEDREVVVRVHRDRHAVTGAGGDPRRVTADDRGAEHGARCGVDHLHHILLTNRHERSSAALAEGESVRKAAQRDGVEDRRRRRIHHDHCRRARSIADRQPDLGAIRAVGDRPCGAVQLRAEAVVEAAVAHVDGDDAIGVGPLRVQLRLVG